MIILIILHDANLFLLVEVLQDDGNAHVDHYYEADYEVLTWTSGCRTSPDHLPRCQSLLPDVLG